MSVSATLDIELFEGNIDSVEIIECLLRNGWRIEDNGKKVYLPINDDGMFNWQSEDIITEYEVIEILRKKNSINEVLGVSLSWLDTNIGGAFLVRQDLSISMSLSNNRQLNSYGVTDFDWYLSKIVPILNKRELNIESIAFFQSN